MLFNTKHKKTKSVFLSIFLGVFLAVEIVGFTFLAKPAHAAGLPVVDAVASGQRASSSVWDTILKTLYATGLSALMTGVSYMTRKIAYDTAVYAATGFKGQKPLIFTDRWDEYLATEGGNAAATAIDQFGESFGLNLCGFPNVRLQAQVQIGLRTLYDQDQFGVSGPQPTCSWQQVSELWDAENYTKLGDSALNVFSDAISVRESDFGITLAAIEKIDRFQAVQQQAKFLERLEGKGYKAVKGLISDNIRTPANIVEEETKVLTAKHQGEITYSQISGIYGSGALEILPQAASVFINTFLSQGLNNLLTEGLVPDKAPSESGDGVGSYYAESIVSRKKATEQAFSYLFTAVPKKQLGAYDALAELAACPKNSTGLNNCVIDEGLKQAITRAKQGEALTIEEAMAPNVGLLNGDWPLISPLRIADNTDLDCRLKGYCYSNIQKLRKLRVLPTGFEIAALRSDPDKPWTLRQVVEGYNNCDFLDPPKNTKVKYNPKKPFCRLIDPNWIIRLPETRCESTVFGPELVTDGSPDRREECVDISTCITEGPNGECIGDEYYGYCTREQNIWHIGQESCPAQFNTCKTFVDAGGSARSYLSRTIDYGACNIDTVGCRAYSLERKNVGQAASPWKHSDEVNLELKKLGRNQVMYFNSKVANFSCQGGEGCNAFYQAEETDTGYKKPAQPKPIYLKKAPDYLGCYDTNPTQLGIQWPKTKSDLAALPGHPACNSFANVCLPEEVECQQYNAVASGNVVSGIIGTKFACDEVCVGYDAFKQEASSFEKDKYPLYFIPDNARSFMEINNLSCSAAEVGCEEFTNLNTEDLEYYTNIKYCEQPDGNNEKAFYSWEGDQATGFVLKTHKLLQIDQEEFSYINDNAKPALGASSVAKVFPIGSPAYAEDSKKKLEAQYAICNETLYKNLVNNVPNAPKADADCRALYDDDGKVFYRLLANTVVVSDQCQDLRRTTATFEVDTDIASKQACDNKAGVWQNNQCQRCMGGGEFKNGSCVYAAITGVGQSTSCTPAANGCRKYVGSTGNNTGDIFKDEFEPNTPDDINKAVEGYAATGGNGVAKMATESIQVGLHSLQVDAKTLTRTVPVASILPGEDDLYEISFWAKGGPLALTIELKGEGNVSYTLTQNNQTGQASSASVGNEWRQYKYGPVRIDKEVKKPTLVFTSKVNGIGSTYFLDNLRFTRITDTYYLVKDSWKTPEGYDVPLICDAKPNDPFPGTALGCQAYTFTNSDGNTQQAFATGFEKLCRQDAIGCEALYDTYNTVEIPFAEDAHIYKLECSNTNTPVTKNTTCELTFGGKNLDDGSCTIGVGETTCLVDHITLEKATDVDKVGNGKVVKSTIIVPEDTPESDPIFLTNRDEFTCQGTQQGCQRVALEEQKVKATSTTYSFPSEATVLNNPDTYLDNNNSILCSQDTVGCSQFGGSAGTSFFKDPLLTGNRICDYRKDVEKDGELVSGWFRSNSEGNVPCYDKFLEESGVYGINSNKSTFYEGFVGACPAQFDQCTELVDRYDISEEFPKGKPYYSLFNAQLLKSIDECGGQASLKEGCVLFDRTEDPKKSYNASATYDASEQKGFISVPPISSAIQGNDSNVILKVGRDRACSEWLACKTAVTKKDDKGVPQRLCYDFRACDEVSGGECANWKDYGFGDELLTDEKYVTRDASWHGEDYTGYSLLNKYQITYYDYIVTGTPFMVYKMHPDYFADNEQFDCIENGQAKTDWSVCGFAPNKGRCFDGQCIQPVAAPFPIDADENSPGKVLKALGDNTQCKAYPEKTAPFPQSVLKQVATEKKNEAKKQNPKAQSGQDSMIPLVEDNNVIKKQVRYEFPYRKAGFSQVGICQGKDDCSCSYTKVEYGSPLDVDYWSAKQKQEKSIPPGQCVGGDNAGDPCSEDSHCFSGTCGKITRQEDHLGLTGFCLERDLSRPIDGGEDLNGDKKFACLTWLPIDVNPAGLDNYNLFQGAGYSPSLDAVTEKKQIGGEVMCRRSTAIGAGPYDKALLPVFKDTSGTYFNKQYPICYDDSSDPNQNLPVQNLCGAPQPFANDSDKFNNKGAVIQYSCDSSDHSDFNRYRMVACNATGNKRKDFYEAILSWARKDGFGLVGSGQNVVVLRTETGHESKLTSKNEGKDIYPTKLIPIDEWDGMTKKTDGSCFTNQPQAGGTEGKLIVRHPPRLWNEEQGKFKQIKYFTQGPNAEVWHHEGNYYQDEKGCKSFDGKLNVSGVAAYPGEVFYDEQRTKDYLYRSPYELVMNRRDLNKVFFVPTLFPGGAEGNNPLLLSKQVYIDFAELDARLDKYTKGEAQTLSMKNSVKGFPNDSVLDEDDGEYKYKNAGDNFNGKFIDAEVLFAPEDSSQLAPGGFKPTVNKDNAVYTYVVTPSQDNDLNKKHYELYEGSGSDPKFAKAAKDSRNYIDRRYVLVYHNDHNAKKTKAGMNNKLRNLEWIRNNLDKNTGIPKADPFTEKVVCDKRLAFPTDDKSDETDEDRYGGNNWFAIGMDFNKNGEFLGYVSRWCMQTNNNALEDGGINMAVIAQVKDQCVDYVQVSDTTKDGVEDVPNKAWTNRVWIDAPWQAGISGRLLPDVDIRPFGSTELTGKDLQVYKKEKPNEINVDVVKALSERRITNPKVDGYPFVCMNPLIKGFGFANINAFGSDNACGGVELGVGSNSKSGIKNPEKEFNDASTRLYNLFARSYKVVQRAGDVGFANKSQWNTWDGTDYAKDSKKWLAGSNVIGGIEDRGNKVGKDLSPPVIYSLNPQTCFRETGATCGVGEKDNITVSEKNGTRTDYNGDEISDEDPQGIGLHEAIIRNKNFGAVVNFYAAADDNRMPLRRVMMNWDDGSFTNDETFGRYKNHKPYCDTAEAAQKDKKDPDNRKPDVGLCMRKSDTIPSLMTCQEDKDCPVVAEGQEPYECAKADAGQGELKLPGYIKKGVSDHGTYQEPRFGNAPRACEDNFFEFRHGYTCPKDFQQKVNQTAFGGKHGYVLSPDTIARLEALGVKADANVCVFKPKVQALDYWGWCNGTCAGGKGCYNNVAGIQDQCDKDNAEPWTEYNGSIIIIP